MEGQRSYVPGVPRGTEKRLAERADVTNRATYLRIVEQGKKSLRPGESARVYDALAKALTGDYPPSRQRVESWVEGLIAKGHLQKKDRFEAVEVLLRPVEGRVDATVLTPDLAFADAAEELKKDFNDREGSHRTQVIDHIVALHKEFPLTDHEDLLQWVERLIAQGYITAEQKMGYFDLADRILYDALHLQFRYESKAFGGREETLRIRGLYRDSARRDAERRNARARGEVEVDET